MKPRNPTNIPQLIDLHDTPYSENGYSEIIATFYQQHPMPDIVKKQRTISKKQYYEYMNHWPEKLEPEALKETWYKCFHYVLKKRKFSEASIRDLFDNCEMANFEILHPQNTIYKDYTAIDLYNHFKDDCAYSCDRMSYDRLLRIHWAFKWTLQKGKEW